ncbi:MAG: hypothetical protein M1820_004454 [Bogoriella megaspora]|nr:MAG: hypothetical protein M1820_004454 [Bogoriella megaspora]
MSNPNVHALDNFTPTLHSTLPNSLIPGLHPSTTFSHPLTVLIIGASRGIGAAIAT